VVGSNQDSKNNWTHAFIWQNNVMTDLNTLFPASSNLYATMANSINARGKSRAWQRTDRTKCGQAPLLSGNPSKRKRG